MSYSKATVPTRTCSHILQSHKNRYLPQLCQGPLESAPIPPFTPFPPRPRSLTPLSVAPKKKKKDAETCLQTLIQRLRRPSSIPLVLAHVACTAPRRVRWLACFINFPLNSKNTKTSSRGCADVAAPTTVYSSRARQRITPHVPPHAGPVQRGSYPREQHAREP